ncbi:MAG: ABC1 kinase family protein [Bdellovibrionales bacterium]
MSNHSSGNSDSKKKLTKIKTGLFARTMSLAKLSTQMTAGLATQKLTGLMKSEDDKEKGFQNFILKQATQFSQEIGELKGSLMKAGQMLSVYGEYFFPPEVNAVLKTLQNESPSLHWPEMLKILRNEWTAEQLNQFEIETEALASASMGQVHRARLKSTNETVVIKIQYPGVETAIESDLKALKKFLSLVEILPKDLSLDPIMKELKEMLTQEMDYHREVELMETYRQHLGEDPRYVIPKIFKAFCTKKIIVQSFERGLKGDDPIVQSLPQDRRNRLASNFLDLYFKELFEWHLIQTDPHLGNYRLRMDPRGQDQIVLFDFGATKKFDPQFMANYSKMIQGAIEKSPLFVEASFKLGFIRPDDDPKLIQIFKDFCYQTVEPFGPGAYDWKKTDLPKRITQLGISIAKEFPLRTPPREIVFLDRKTAGVFIFLSVLGAHFEAGPLIKKYLYGKTAP